MSLLTFDRTYPTLLVGGDTVTGRALQQRLTESGYENLTVIEGRETRDKATLRSILAQNRIKYVFFAAGKSGGISANIHRPAELMLDNLQLIVNLITAAHDQRINKMLYLASSCCYPRKCPQPMKEDKLLTGSLEPTNESYAVSKIAGLKLTQAMRLQYGVDFICAIPANEFGPGDKFDLDDSHVVSALLRRMHEAKEAKIQEVAVWGSGKPVRDFIFSLDLADACILAMEQYSAAAPINLGTGLGISIAHLARAIKKVVGFTGQLSFDKSKQDGMPKKVLDVSKLQALGWLSSTSLEEALSQTYAWYLQQLDLKPCLTSDV